MKRLTTVRLLDDTSPRHHLYKGAGLGAFFRQSHVPAFRSATQGGYSVRTRHLPDLRALFDASGIRLVDQREGNQS